MIGKTIIELDSIDSTNAYASRIVTVTDFEDGTVIWAYDQFAGRGQHDHCWMSEAGKNLTCTVCLKPYFLSPERQFLLNKAIALGVLDFIMESLGQSKTPVPKAVPSIKWPNDIYIGDQKTGGILIESRIMGSAIESSIAGIGLNINQTRFDPGIPNPVALIDFLQHETPLKDALASLCGFLNNRYLALKKLNPAGLDQEFNQNILGFDQWRNLLHEGTQMEAKIRGVDSYGRLLVETRHGEILSFCHKEVEYVF